MDLAFYDSDGRPVAYTDDGERICLLSGRGRVPLRRLRLEFWRKVSWSLSGRLDSRQRRQRRFLYRDFQRQRTLETAQAAQAVKGLKELTSRDYAN